MTEVAPSNQKLSSADVIWSSNSLTQSDVARALLFESREMLFALDARVVSEVVAVPVIQKIPGSPVWFCGVAIVRGCPVPVFDAARFLNPSSPALVFNRAIVVRAASSTYLIAADKILNLCSLSTFDPQPVSSVVPEYVEHRAIENSYHYDNRLLSLIDLPELLRCTKLLRECAVN